MLLYSNYNLELRVSRRNFQGPNQIDTTTGVKIVLVGLEIIYDDEYISFESGLVVQIQLL